jgi:2-polyprenyl-3-methyl-5-hydroxy-6-metoxy-1,4-benzoquinol methylase
MNRQIDVCSTCGLVIVPAGLSRTDSGASIYEDENGIFFAEGNESYYLDETNFRSARLKLEWINSYLPAKARLLDAGSNFGHFLSLARQRYQAIGFELSPQAVAWSRENLQVENHVGSIYDPPDECRGPHDAITCWDVIEHLEDPVNALGQLARLLNPGGLLFLSTPNAGSSLARGMGRRWHYLDPVQHLHLFRPQNLRLALKQAGFEVLAFRTFGHYYRLGYVFDRLSYLHQNDWLGMCARGIGKLIRPAANFTVYMNLGDVMGTVARRP